jgi:hypothetical protein
MYEHLPTPPAVAFLSPDVFLVIFPNLPDDLIYTVTAAAVNVNGASVSAPSLPVMTGAIYPVSICFDFIFAYVLCVCFYVYAFVFFLCICASLSAPSSQVLTGVIYPVSNRLL